jgi:opacity protein-like surface antigen
LKRIVLILSLLTACSSFAFGQASPDATRAGDLQVGGTFTFAYPDYSPQDAFGGGAYAAFDFKPTWGAEFAFHLISLDQHSPAKELTYEVGPRYHRTYGRYNPYVKGLGGRGKFDFNPNFLETVSNATQGQSYWMLTGGAGVDYQLTYRFNVRIEVEYQHWFTNSTSNLPHGLTPILYQAGFAYHFSGGAPSY